MSAIGEVDNLAVEQPAAEATVAEQPQVAEKAVKEKKPKAPKERKPKVPKEKKARAPKTASHPPYFQMIKDALLSLNEKTGSSTYAIAKYMEEKLKPVLPANFRKTLGLQLKNSVAKGKLIKIRASYKLSEAGKKENGTGKTPKAITEAKKPKRAAVVPKGRGTEKRKAETVKKTGPKKTRKSAAAVKPKQPKSIKSPAAKRARKATA
ncbi:histone H1 [Rhododendron vialii]|uniref:histone H1 n=1 Tax=Rhododendron vialii TaxID=182163 RepID=UPI00265E0E34|nr:histone H1 [Rhododendron vialii]